MLPPGNPHPDSILWRASYTPLNEKAEILHDQAQYWVRRNVHYHQFLEAGENTLNLKLCALLGKPLREVLLQPIGDQKKNSYGEWLAKSGEKVVSATQHRLFRGGFGSVCRLPCVEVPRPA